MTTTTRQGTGLFHDAAKLSTGTSSFVYHMKRNKTVHQVHEAFPATLLFERSPFDWC